jgi:hypothetical protein
MTNPYEALPKRAFWRRAVAQVEPLAISDLWQPKFEIQPVDVVATAGSCFAQHIGKALAKSGYQWLDGEPAPRLLSEEDRVKYNYGIFSFRVGNIYTVALLRQWVEWALGVSNAPSEIWEEDGRFYDPFRPVVEPEGFASRYELLALRATTLVAIRQVFETATLFVFTLGLTEGWVNAEKGYAYPLCPGTIKGAAFDADAHKFRNYGYHEISDDLNATIDLLKSVNPNLRVLLTVSPVPLTATATAKHVLVATTYSKSTLRAVAGDVSAEREDTDYFPSYEIISSFPFRGMFYADNKREVLKDGVEHVMKSFFSGLAARGLEDKVAVPITPDKAKAAPSGPSRDIGIGAASDEVDNVVCEEILLEAFGRSAR